MKKLFKVLLWIVGSVVFLGLCGYVFLQATYERDFSGTPLPNIKASEDPRVIAQGDYLVHAVAHCSACHQPVHSMQRFQLTLNRTDLRGGFEFVAGPFGRFFAANLTSDKETGIGAVSDGQLARTIRHGVDRRGRFAAFMSFAVGNMADEDLRAVISYLRTLPPKRNPVPHDEWGLIAKALSSKFAPHDEKPIKYVPAGGVSLERGEYLANGPAGCYNCHSEHDMMNGFVIVGPRFAGNPDADPDETNPRFELTAPNLTPDPKTGRIAAWSEDVFLARFNLGPTFKGSHMPWNNFKQLTDDDKRSIFRYLQSLPPTVREVGPSRRPKGWKPPT